MSSGSTTEQKHTRFLLWTSSWDNRRSCAFVVSLTLTELITATPDVLIPDKSAQKDHVWCLSTKERSSLLCRVPSRTRDLSTLAALQGSLIGWFLAFMQLALSPLSSSSFFSCLPRYFSPLQSIHFRDFRSSALKKKKKKKSSNPTFFSPSC